MIVAALPAVRLRRGCGDSGCAQTLCNVVRQYKVYCVYMLDVLQYTHTDTVLTQQSGTRETVCAPSRLSVTVTDVRPVLRIEVYLARRGSACAREN